MNSAYFAWHDITTVGQKAKNFSFANGEASPHVFGQGWNGRKEDIKNQNGEKRDVDEIGNAEEAAPELIAKFNISTYFDEIIKSFI